MQKHGIKTIFWPMWCLGNGPTSDASLVMQLGFMLFGPLKNIYKYKKLEENSTERTIVRLPLLTDKPATDYKIHPDSYKWSARNTKDIAPNSCQILPRKLRKRPANTQVPSSAIEDSTPLPIFIIVQPAIIAM